MNEKNSCFERDEIPCCFFACIIHNLAPHCGLLQFIIHAMRGIQQDYVYELLLLLSNRRPDHRLDDRNLNFNGIHWPRRPDLIDVRMHVQAYNTTKSQVKPEASQRVKQKFCPHSNSFATYKNMCLRNIIYFLMISHS